MPCLSREARKTLVVVSVKEYKETQEKVSKLEKLLETIENIRLLQLVVSRDNSQTIPFEDFVAEEGLTMDELKKLAGSVERNEKVLM